MFDPSILPLKGSENSYMLASIIGKRAIQLMEGSKTLTECNSNNAVTVAISEYKENKLSYTTNKRDENAIK